MFIKVLAKFFIYRLLLQRCAECLAETLWNESDGVIITEMRLLNEKKGRGLSRDLVHPFLLLTCRVEGLSERYLRKPLVPNLCILAIFCVHRIYCARTSSWLFSINTFLFNSSEFFSLHFHQVGTREAGI